MKTVSVKYNIAVTFLLIAFAIIMMPFYEVGDESPLLIEEMSDNPTVITIIAAISGILSIILSMIIIRSLWNRLFPRLCGWNEIGYADSYALSIIVGYVVVSGL